MRHSNLPSSQSLTTSMGDLLETFAQLKSQIHVHMVALHLDVFRFEQHHAARLIPLALPHLTSDPYGQIPSTMPYLMLALERFGNSSYGHCWWYRSCRLHRHVRMDRNTR